MSGGSNGNVLGAVTGAAGVTILPNTSGSRILQVISIAAIVLSVLVLSTAAFRAVAKRIYK